MNDELYQQQLNIAQAQHAQQQEMQEQDRARQAENQPPKPVTFPWLMFCVALLFDLIGLIPIVCIFSEIIAGLILWLWQKSYVPKLNPLISIVATKILDFILGFAMVSWLPSNMITVIAAYIKKKAVAKAKTKLGGKIVAKLAT